MWGAQDPTIGVHHPAGFRYIDSLIVSWQFKPCCNVYK